MKTLSIEDWGSFHIGGRFARVEGLGMREVRYSASWCETYNADATYAIVRDGRAVYSVDPVERDRSGWAMYPNCAEGEPVFMSAERAFESFRFGEKGGYHAAPKQRHAFRGTQFPVKAFDAFVKQVVPRWTTTAAAAKAAMQALLEKPGGAVVVAFSTAATQALQLAEKHHHLFDALVLIEPNDVGTEQSASGLVNIPMLAVFGDFIDQHPMWLGIVARLEKWLEPCLGDQGKASILPLPSIGQLGNSRLLIMDRNNLKIATHIRAWLDKVV
ncbi:hypothetical protein SAMN05444172_2389 [Burkholderia sp. GAS332]|nr:hypothetical protein SAMN05444172_2389 [Burkholderia sp. GAS332]